MKTGKTINELAAEITRQAESKKDYIADTRAIKMNSGDRGISLTGLNGSEYGITKNCHQQIGARVRIPKMYYDRMLSNSPDLLAQNVNHWLGKEPEKRMVRTLDGSARAFLSGRFRPLDNIDLMEAVLPEIANTEMRVESCEVTDTRLYLKAFTPKITAEIRKGDVVQAGIIISNSEVGAGSLQVSPMIFRLVCSNGLIASDSSLRKYHVGRLSESLEGAVQFYSDRTIAADNKAFFLKVKDIVRGVMTQDTFSALVGRMRETTNNEIQRDPVAFVEDVTDKYGFQEDERGKLLRWLVAGGDMTQYGLLNAITRTAHDEIESYDRSTEIERIGGDVLALSDVEWRKIATERA